PPHRHMGDARTAGEGGEGGPAATGPARHGAPRGVRRRASRRSVGDGRRDQRLRTTSTMSWLASVGLRPTLAPASRRASIFAWAVPLPPETMAPAWPIFLPGGAVTPAM